MRTLFKREIFTLWLTPAPYLSFLALLGTCGYFLLRYLDSYSERVSQYKAGFLAGSDTPNFISWVIEPYFETIGFFLVVIVPVLSARLFSEEKLNGSLERILSTPIKIFHVILAKFLALYLTLLFLLLFVTIPAGYLLFTLYSSSIDIAASSFFSGFLALVLLSMIYTATGCAVSQTIAHPIAASLIHLSLLIVLYFLHSAELYFFSPVLRSTRILEGMISAVDIAYFLSITFGCLLYTYIHLKREEEV